jgi:hypothetical protein
VDVGGVKELHRSARCTQAARAAPSSGPTTGTQA